MLASDSFGIARRSPVIRAAATGPIPNCAPTRAIMPFVISSRNRASHILRDDDEGVWITVTAPSANPTAPIRSNQAFRAKSYPPGSEGDGGG